MSFRSTSPQVFHMLGGEALDLTHTASGTVGTIFTNGFTIVKNIFFAFVDLLVFLYGLVPDVVWIILGVIIVIFTVRICIWFYFNVDDWMSRN